MKAASSTSSVKSSTTSTTTTVEERGSCYYPGCRKDANCNCEVCLASINATLDLMPISIQKSSLTKLSTSRPKVEGIPVSFNPSVMSTPRSSSCLRMESPVLKSTARLSLNEKTEKRERRKGFGGVFLRLALYVGLVFAVEVGFSRVVSGVLNTVLSPDTVRIAGERSLIVQDLNGRLRFLRNELQGIVDETVLNCSDMNSTWEINQDGLLLISRCTLYKSSTEEVSIWGWPLQTAGLLTTGFSSRYFTILFGRVTEWSDGKIGYSIRKANASWAHGKWGASVVQLDPNTWVLEYKRNSILENSCLFSAALELLKYRTSRVVSSMSKDFWLFSAFANHYSEFLVNDRIDVPT